MDRKIDAGALLVVAAALLLVVSLFLNWFGVRGTAEVSAWELFETLDLVLLGAAVAAVAAAFGRLDSRVLLGAALVVVVVVVTQLIEPPLLARESDREVGAWLALVAAALLLAGAALVAAQIAVTVDVRGRERRRRVATVDKRGAAAASPPVVGEERLAPGGPREERAPVADRFAPGPPAQGGSRGTEATQPFRADPDDPAR